MSKFTFFKGASPQCKAKTLLFCFQNVVECDLMKINYFSFLLEKGRKLRSKAIRLQYVLCICIKLTYIRTIITKQQAFRKTKINDVYRLQSVKAPFNQSR